MAELFLARCPWSHGTWRKARSIIRSSQQRSKARNMGSKAWSWDVSETTVLDRQAYALGSALGCEGLRLRGKNSGTDFSATWRNVGVYIGELSELRSSNRKLALSRSEEFHDCWIATCRFTHAFICFVNVCPIKLCLFPY